LAKYLFSQGHVFVDEGAFTPILTKSTQSVQSSVLLILQNHWQTQISIQEKSDVKQKEEKQ
jgi:hypothetical protein